MGAKHTVVNDAQDFKLTKIWSWRVLADEVVLCTPEFPLEVVLIICEKMKPKNHGAVYLDQRYTKFDVLGSAGKTDVGQFDGPRGIDIDSQGRIYVVDDGNRRIQILSRKGEWSEQRMGNSMAGISIDHSSGKIYVVDTSYGKVQILSQNFELLLKFPENRTMLNCHGITLDGSGNISVVSLGAHQIETFTQTGKSIKTLSMREPFGISYDWNSGRFVVSCSAVLQSKIHIFNSEGNSIFSFGKYGDEESDEMRFPFGVYVDRNSNIVVCDFNNWRIQVFDSAGKLRNSIVPEPAVQPLYCVVEEDGSVVITTHQSTIVRCSV
jgi:DNA-binding beta-propeller fold protein YncE